MRAFCSDLLHGVRGLWFACSVLAAAVCLWLDLGTDSYWLLHGGGLDPLELLSEALSGTGSALSLPLLAALPCGAAAFLELSSGAARMAVFRCGRGSYVAGKLLSLLLLAASSQLLGAGLFTAVLLALSPAAVPFPAARLLARALAAMLWAAVGGAGALLTGDAVSALVVPTGASYACSMLASRFFPDALLADPLSWLTGEKPAVLLLLALTTAASALYAVLLSREVRRHV